VASTSPDTSIEVTTKNKLGEKSTKTINLSEFIDIKGWKSVGNKLGGKEIAKIKLLSNKVIDPSTFENKIKESSENAKDGNQPELF
jgi:hypothetical protein